MKKLLPGMVSLAAMAVALWGVPVVSYSGAANAMPQIHDRWTGGHNHSGGHGEDGNGQGNNGGGNEGGNGGSGGGDDHNGCKNDDKKHCHGVPEPSTLALFTIGMVGISATTLIRRRRVKA